MVESVNLIPFIFSIAAYMAVSMFWYSPSLFGNIWARAYKKDPEKSTPGPFTYGSIIILGGIISWVLGMIIGAVHPTGLIEGMKIGFYCWFGFVASTQFSGVIWTKKPIQAYLIDIGCFLINFLLISALFTLLR